MVLLRCVATPRNNAYQGINMYKKFITPVYIINMVMQALFSLIAPIGLMLGLAYLLVTYAEWPTWVYVIFIMLGVLSGLYSMVSFILGASRALEALERQHREGSAADDAARVSPCGISAKDEPADGEGSGSAPDGEDRNKDR